MSLCFNKQRLVLTAIPTMAIISGMLTSDAALDKGGQFNCGGMVFSGGWILLAMTLMLKPENGTLKFEASKANLYRAGAALLVMLSANYAQGSLSSQSSAHFRTSSMFFMMSWALFVLTLGYDFDTGNFHKRRLTLAALGGILILSGMGVLTLRDRKFNVNSSMSGQLSEGNVYGPGMPMFTLGWVLIVLSIAIE